MDSATTTPAANAPSRPSTVPPIAELKRENIVRVYSGRPGCGCGCRGDYTENDGSNPGTITRVLNTLKRRADEVVAYPDSLGGERYNAIYALEDEKRYRWIYAKV